MVPCHSGVYHLKVSPGLKGPLCFALLWVAGCAGQTPDGAPPHHDGAMGLNKLYGKATADPTEKTRAGEKAWGYDISKWQGTVNYALFSSAAEFVVVKASGGAPKAGQTASQYRDSKFLTNRAGAVATGMVVGFYHFAYPESNSAVAEANCFADNVGPLKPGQFAVLDYESPWTGDPVPWCLTWLQTVQARLGVRPLIYMNLSMARAHTWTPVISGGYPLWLARWDYDRNAAAPTNPWPSTLMRQYSDNETVSGIVGPVDGDVLYGGVSALNPYRHWVPDVTVSARVVPGSPRTVEVTLTNANPVPASGVKLDQIRLMESYTPTWTLGALGPSASVSRVFSLGKSGPAKMVSLTATCWFDGQSKPVSLVLAL